MQVGKITVLHPGLHTIQFCARDCAIEWLKDTGSV